MRPIPLLTLGVGLIGCAPLAPHIQALPAELAVEPDWQPSEEILQGEGFTRQDVAFPCGASTCAAWLYLPEGPELAPVVVMGNGFCGERHGNMPDYAERFAQAGLAAMVFDYRGWGDSGGLPRYVFVAEQQVEDYQSAVAWARSSPLVRGERLAVWGTSASGGHVVSAAARDPRIDALVAQVPSIRQGGQHDHSMFPEGTLWPWCGWASWTSSASSGARSGSTSAPTATARSWPSCRASAPRSSSCWTPTAAAGPT